MVIRIQKSFRAVQTRNGSIKLTGAAKLGYLWSSGKLSNWDNGRVTKDRTDFQNLLREFKDRKKQLAYRKAILDKQVKAAMYVQKFIKGARTRVKLRKDLEKQKKIRKGGEELDKKLRDEFTRSGWGRMFKDIDVRHRYNRSPKMRNWFRKAQ